MYLELVLGVRVYRGRARGREKKKEACGFVILTSGPPISGKEAARRREKVELLTFGKGPLASD